MSNKKRDEQMNHQYPNSMNQRFAFSNGWDAAVQYMTEVCQAEVDQLKGRLANLRSILLHRHLDIEALKEDDAALNGGAKCK